MDVFISTRRLSVKGWVCTGVEQVAGAVLCTNKD